MTRILNLDPSAFAPRQLDPDAAGGEVVSVMVPHHTQLAVDSQLGTAHRVLGHVGLSGGTHWLVPDGDDTTSGSRVYPDKTTARTLARAYRVPLSPGCLVGLQVLAAPSGPCQRSDGEGGYIEDASVGIVRAVVTYREPSGSTLESSAVVAVPPSDEPLNGEPGEAFDQLLVLEALAEPQLADDDLAGWASWLGIGVVADIEVEVVGSTRALDIVVVEVPSAVVVPATVVDPWPAAMYSDDDGTPHADPLTDWPLVQLDTDDKRGGTSALAEAIASHGDRLGPVLWWWSSGEGAEAIGTLADWIADAGAPPLVIDNAVWTHVATGHASTDDALPGVLAASLAAPLVSSGDEAFGRRTGVLPVWIAARLRVAGTGSASVLVQTSKWDGYEVSTSSLAFGWQRVPGWLEVGASPETAPTLRAFAKSSVDGLQLELTDVVVAHRQMG